MNELPIVIAVISISGAAGGYANWILRSINEAEDSRYRLGWIGYLTVGVVASFVVPLFLSMAQSNLLSEKTPDTFNHRMLVLCGFCIIASFSSRAFMNSISEKILQQVKKAENQAKEAKQAANEAEAATEEIRENIQNPQTKSVNKKATAQESDSWKNVAEGLTDLERAVLKSASALSMRTKSGIAKDANLEKENAGSQIDKLIKNGLLEIVKSEATGGLRYTLTKNGINVLNFIN
jgi:predicted transcriptional regulator/fluoride ion exporter CrcB/FEX